VPVRVWEGCSGFDPSAWKGAIAQICALEPDRGSAIREVVKHVALSVHQLCLLRTQPAVGVTHGHAHAREGS